MLAFTPRMITIKITITMTILASILAVVICRFNCLRSLKLVDTGWLPMFLSFISWRKFVLKVIPTISFFIIVVWT